MPPRNRELSEQDVEFREVVGANIRRRRERRGLSIEALAGVADVAVSTMSRIELGQQVITTDTLARVALALGTSAATLCRRPTPEPQAAQG